MTGCQFAQHGHLGYGDRDGVATVMVRVTCPQCDYFRIVTYCQGCLSGIAGSGRMWRCAGCQKKTSPTTKMQYVVRIGDA